VAERVFWGVCGCSRSQAERRVHCDEGSESRDVGLSVGSRQLGEGGVGTREAGYQARIAETLFSGPFQKQERHARAC
jgi:hypothetical protein